MQQLSATALRSANAQRAIVKVWPSLRLRASTAHIGPGLALQESRPSPSRRDDSSRACFICGFHITLGSDSDSRSCMRSVHHPIHVRHGRADLPTALPRSACRQAASASKASHRRPAPSRLWWPESPNAANSFCADRRELYSVDGVQKQQVQQRSSSAAPSARSQALDSTP